MSDYVSPEHREFTSKVSCSTAIKYVRMHEGYTTVIMQDDSQEIIDLTIGELEYLLKDKPFFRIHKSYLINLEHLREMVIRNKQLLACFNDQELPVSRRKKNLLLKTLKPID